MVDITAASQEQTQGIEQINQAITQMDLVTQQNAALVEEAAAAASSLQEQAASLSQVVSVFRLDNEQHSAKALQPDMHRPPPVNRAHAAAGCQARHCCAQMQSGRRCGFPPCWIKLDFPKVFPWFADK